MMWKQKDIDSYEMISPTMNKDLIDTFIRERRLSMVNV